MFDEIGSVIFIDVYFEGIGLVFCIGGIYFDEVMGNMLDVLVMCLVLNVVEGDVDMLVFIYVVLLLIEIVV